MGHYAWPNRTRVVRYHGNFTQFGKKGSSDVLCCLRGGKMLGVECKIGRDRLRPEQIVFRDELEKRGSYYVEVRSTQDLWDFVMEKGLY